MKDKLAQISKRVEQISFQGKSLNCGKVIPHVTDKIEIYIGKKWGMKTFEELIQTKINKATHHKY